MLIAHRESSTKSPENTLPAFQLSWEQGGDAIEADFQLTKDGHIVCFHDKDTKRVESHDHLEGDKSPRTHVRGRGCGQESAR